MESSTKSAIRHGAILRLWQAQSTPRARLLCCPHAGGSASAYREWQRDMAPEVEVVSVQPPGRENRLGDPAHLEMASLVDEILAGLDDFDPLPTALFGHSLGASVAFELAHALSALARPPVLLVLSGRRAPHRHSKTRIAQLDDESLIKELRGFGGTADEIFEHPELVQLILPTFRADMHLLEGYSAPQRPPLSCPMRVFGGRLDELTTPRELEEWRRYSHQTLSIETLSGGHFFLFEEAAPELRARVKSGILAAL